MLTILHIVLTYLFVIQWLMLYVIDESIGARSINQHVCLHEISHTALVWSHNMTSAFTDATIEAKDGGGLTRWMTVAGESDADLWCLLTISMAGMTGEEMFLGRHSVADTDLKQSFEFSSKLLQRGSFTPPWKVSKPTRPALTLAKHFDTATPEQLAIVELACETARTVIKSYGKRFFALRDALLKQKTMREDDVERVLGSRRAIRFAGAHSMFYVSQEILDESGITEHKDAA